MVDVAVIGGGAAGLCAALSAANSGASVQILEASERVGSKILATGNGRCNLTNMNLSAADYNHPEFVAPTLNQLGPKQVRAWFKQLGLLTVEEREGRVYPLSNTANSVLDVLRLSCQRAGITITTGAKATRLAASADGSKSILLEDGTHIDACKAIVACGGGSQLLATCGHAIAAEQPVLCAIATNTDPIRGLNGTRVKARMSLLEEDEPEPVFSEFGELLFRDYGISGIAAFNASRFVKPGQTAIIDFLPDMDFAVVVALLCERNKWASNYEELLTGMFHPQLNRALLRTARCKVSAETSAMGIQTLARLIKKYSIEVKGPGDVKHAQVTRGGAALEEFDSTTLESKLVPGLYACGECLDVDGPCGGYNLHWAWASGLIAGAQAGAR